jgi:hypothetical protein
LVDSGNGAWLYVPDVTYFGPDTFTYIVSDGQLTSQPITVTIDISIGGGPGGGNNGGGTVTGGVMNIATQTTSTATMSTQAIVTTANITPITSGGQETQAEGFVGPTTFVDSLGAATLVEARPLLLDGSNSQLSLAPLFVRQDFMSRHGDGAITRLLAPTANYTPFNVMTMNTMLDALRDEVEMRWDTLNISTSSVTVTAVGLTAGYAIWALRGAHLFATLLTTVPAWWSVDPLPILTANRALKMREDDQDESLADIASGRKKKSLELREESGVSRRRT